MLISFLNAVLLLENEKKITDVTILTPYQLPALQGGKVTIVDVMAKDQSGKNYIVEMQVADLRDIDKRVLYYASKSYSSQIESGENYEKLNPVYFIGILDFEVTQNSNYISRHRVLDIETGENFIADVEFTFIKLPKFNKEETELHNIIDQWVYFIKNAVNLSVIPESVEDEGLKSAYQDADKHNWTREELLAYNKVFMRIADDRGKIAKAEEKVQENIAKNLLKMGMSLESVAAGTELTLEEVRKIWEKQSQK